MIAGANGNAFLESVHGQLSCQTCHGGPADETFANMGEAHAGIVRDPSATGSCNGCHAEIAAATANSLHTNLWGEHALIQARGNCTAADYQEGYDVNCGGCHTTCGQCHISRPSSVGGGLVSAHKVRPTPHMTEQCTACHGSRIGVDYLGEEGGGIAGNLADVHRSHGFGCEDCHSAAEIHGDGLSENASGHYEGRYEVASMPRCENCHSGEQGTNAYHGNTHWGRLQCQVCHSQPYKNCTNCHVDDGLANRSGSFTIDPSVPMLKIGLNTQPELRDYEYVIVRHAPVSTETYEDWGLDLPDFDTIPTWKYSSPHNIQRWTAQTTVEEGQSCAASCHGSGNGTESFFLREADLRDEQGAPLPDRDANLSVTVPDGTPIVF